LELALESAQQELVAAQATLDQLAAGASETVIARAARENAQQVAQAEVALRIKELQLAQARLQDPDAQVRAAEAQVGQLELQVAQARAQSQAPSITSAQADLERAQIALDDTQEEYNKALDRPWEPQEVRDGWAKMLRQAELSYQQAQAQLAGAQNAVYAQSLGADALEVQLEAAQVQLTHTLATQGSYTLTLQTLAAEVDTARLQLEALQAWENPYLDPATDQQLTRAEVVLRQAEIAVARLQLQLTDAKLTAPFAGTVVKLDLKAGDMAQPGAAVAVLATLDQLCARTLDLTEYKVTQVAEGRPAVVTVDALPDHEFEGVIRQVGLRGGDYRGDVVYTVMVDLNEAAGASLRWGMTALVKIKIQD
jgi:multidrug resistance efflux pump